MEQPDLFDETKILTNTSHNGYQRCLGLLENNPNTREWRVLVKLNAILNQNSATCWWYPYFLKEREEFMYDSVKPSTLKVAELRSELKERGLPTTGKKAELVSNLTANMESSKETTLKTVSGKGKKKTKRQLVADYKKLFPQGARMGTSATVDEYINRCVGKIVEEKYKDIILEPNLDILRDFLEEHKVTINRLILQIQPGHRSLLSWTELFRSPTVTTATHRLQGWGGVRIGGLNQDLAWEESKKFANPLYTLLSLSDKRLTTHLLLPWFLEELGIDGNLTYRDIIRVQDTLNVNTNDRIRQNISDNSLKLTRVLLEYIIPRVLNSRNCISPIVEIIRYANMKYPNNVLPNGNLYDEHNDQQTEDRITNIVNTATGMFELLVKFGLRDQGLTDLEFDVLGETWRRVNSQRGLAKVMRYTDPMDPHSQFSRAQRLFLLCHSNLRKYWIETYGTFNRKKIVNVARGLEEENSPFSEMDYDTFRVLGETVKKEPRTGRALRRNTISQGRNQDLISAMQRLNTSRGLKSLTSPIGEGQGVDMELIEKIMNTQRDLNLIEDAKYSESRMGPEEYTEPPPPQFQIGDSIMWGDGLKGVVIGTPKGNLKILGDNMKRYFLSGKTRNMKLIERGPEPFIDSLDGGSKKKKRTKRKAKKKRTIRKGRVKGNNSAYFEFKSGSSRKFWRITKKGNQIITQYGKLGSLGQMTTKDYGSKVDQEYDKLIQSKKKKGYVEKMDFGDPNPKKPTNVEREYIKVCRKAEKSKVLNPNQVSQDCEGMLDQGESELKWMTQWHKDALTKGEYDWNKYNEHYKSKRKTKKTKNQVGGYWKERVYDILECDGIEDKKSTEKCIKNLLRKILAGPDGQEILKSFIDENSSVTLQTYLQDLLRKILAGPDGQELLKSFIDEKSDVTLQKYFQNIIKNILWSIASSLLVGKGGIKPPISWEDDLVDPITIEDVEKETGIYELDPNICLRNLWRAVLIKLIPGSSTVGNIRNSLGNLLFNLRDAETPMHSNMHSNMHSTMYGN